MAKEMSDVDLDAPPQNISITVCGDGGTGKSSISLRLVRCKWTDEYDPTVQDSYSVTRVVDGRTYNLNLTDTAGQEEYRGLWAAQNLAADAYLLVYDITSRESLQALDYFNDLIEMDLEARGPNSQSVPHVKIVAGNKCDLAEGRQVSSAEGLAWARANGCGFMETSARNIVNIEETFQLLVRRVAANREAVAQGRIPDTWGFDDGGEEPREKEVSGFDDDGDERKWRRCRCCVIM